MSMAPPPPHPPQLPPRQAPQQQPPAPPYWRASAPQHEEPGRAPHEPHGERGEHEAEHPFSRLALILALSIAVVSVLGAVVGWRAETHASKASRYEQDAVAASISKAQLSSEADAAASKADQDYTHFTRLGEEAARLDPNACGNNNQQTLSELEAGTACDMQEVFADYDNSDYILNNQFDTTKFAQDYVAANNIKEDTDPHLYETQADNERQHEDRMLYLSLGLVLALVLLTLARLGRTRASMLVLAVPGWLCLVGGAVLLGMTEL